MRRFCWDIPRAQDLRLCGWDLVPASEAPQWPELARAPAVLVVSGPRMRLEDWQLVFAPEHGMARELVIVLDVGDADERVRMLEAGVGDAFAPGIALGELSVRAARVLEAAQKLPRRRELGGLTLDLFPRDAVVKGRPLGLHPREFALLWWLAQSPGQPVGKAELIAEVWRRSHVPDTNSLAVHVSRLRTKLAIAGLDDLVRTTEGGGYMIAA